MKKYAIFIALAAMLCGTEARAASISYLPFIDGNARPDLSSGDLSVTSNFTPFLFSSDLQIDKVIISISGGSGTSFYIDNIKVTADLGSNSLQTIGFDGSDGGVFGNPVSQVLDVPVLGVTGDAFQIQGLNFLWVVAPPGSSGNSIFVMPDSDVLTQLVITLPSRYMLGDDIPSGKKIGDPILEDSGQSFRFHSAELRIINGACDINTPGCGGGGNVPEPASLLLLGAGLAGIGIWRRKAGR